MNKQEYSKVEGSFVFIILSSFSKAQCEKPEFWGNAMGWLSRNLTDELKENILDITPPETMSGWVSGSMPSLTNNL